MNKTKIYGGLAVLLLFINLVLVCFMVFRNEHHPNEEGPKAIIIEKLHFDATQIQAYDKLIQAHRTQIRTTNERIRELKNQLYVSLNQYDNGNRKDSLIAELGKMQQLIEEIHYSHFTAIKLLCRPEQLQDFNSLAKELASLFAQPKRKK